MTGTASRAPKKKRASKCMLCDETTDLHWHHVKPRSLGGTDDPDNLVTLCERHHDVAHSLDDDYSISSLTKIGLEKAKERGVVLGNRVNLKEARAKATLTIKSNADAFAQGVRPMLNHLWKAGMSFRAIAATLNSAAVPTARSGSWSANTVSRLINRHV